MNDDGLPFMKYGEDDGRMVKMMGELWKKKRKLMGFKQLNTEQMGSLKSETMGKWTLQRIAGTPRRDLRSQQ